MATTNIEWATHVLNAFTGCDRVSPGCAHCYAADVAAGNKRRELGRARAAREQGRPVPVMRYQNDGDPKTSGPGFGFTVHWDKLAKPERFPAGARVFVNSMSDVFHEKAPDDAIAALWALFAFRPDVHWLVLTKRPERMRDLLSSEDFVHAVARALDALVVDREIAAMGDEQIVPISGFPGYLVTDRGRVLRVGGSDTCQWCHAPLSPSRVARSKFCGQRCNSKAHYEKKQGRWQAPADVAREMSPDIGDQGHRRVQLIAPDGTPHRVGVHRLVLTAFDRPPRDGEQGCHRNGDPAVNALPNLRWGSQSDNWQDRIRHGNHRSHRVREHADTWIKPDLGFDWPLPNCWAGVTIENRRFVHRADVLRATPAAVRFISAEPLLGPLIAPHHIAVAPVDDEHDNGDPEDWEVVPFWHDQPGPGGPDELDLTGIDWVITGGESGPKHRRFDPDWARDLRDACQADGTRFFMKQMGGPRPGGALDDLPEDLRIRELPVMGVPCPS